MAETQIKSFEELNREPGAPPLATPWKVQAIVNDDNITYIVSNTETKEAILVDPMREDLNALRRLTDSYAGYTWLMVCDTHTHADHVSVGAEMAHHLNTPWVMHELAPSRRVKLRVARDTLFPCKAGNLRLMETPGHAPDALAILWGPILLPGDTLMFGDVGRDDLPGGEPAMHYESLLKIAAIATPEMWVLPGHDNEGGRVSMWKTQLKLNPMLTADRETFMKEAGGWVGPSPKQLKESLYENFK